MFCQEKDEKEAVLLFSRNRNVCSEFEAIVSQRINVKMCGELELLEVLPQKNIVLAYIDVSEVTEHIMDYWKAVYKNPWIKNVPIIALCKEGNLVQYKASINVGVTDILTVPLESEQCKRRMACHLQTISSNEK